MSSDLCGKRNKALGMALGAVTAALAAACGTAPAPSATPIGTPPVPGARSAATGHASPPSGTSAHVGADCGIITAQGNRSMRSMSSRQALAAAAANPRLTAFAAAVRTAGLEKALSAKATLTLMIPSNTAFASLSGTQIGHLHNSADLKKVVEYHAVDTLITPEHFARGASFPTMEGSALKVSRSGSVYKVNGATVLCGNIRTASGTLYIINKVLLPPGG